MAKNKGKICNPKQPNKKVKSEFTVNIDSDNYLTKPVVFDLSFEGAFISIESNNFNNYLRNSDDFIVQFRKVMKNIQNLSTKTMYELINGKEYNHCHKVQNEENVIIILKRVFKKINKSESEFEQELGSEGIYQLGLQSGVRLFGIIKGNIFRVYLIDYFHDCSFDQRRNQRNKKHYDFCPIISPIK